MTERASYPELALYVDGAWLKGDGRATLPVENPSTGETLGHLPVATRDDIDRAVAAAARAFPAWRDTHPQKRVAILRRAAGLVRGRADEISRLMALELGKPVAQGPAEVTRMAMHLEWHAEQSLRALGEVIPSGPDVTQTTLRIPVGPVAAFTPWNGPGASPARKIAAALAAGCTIVIKPAEETPATAVILAECLAEAGVPAGVMNMLFGDPQQISDTLVANPDIRMVTFTGSVPVGRMLATNAGRYLKPCILELGGHCPVIVCDDADPIAAADDSIVPKYRNTGQICVSPTRFFVHDSIFDAFADRFTERAAALAVGDPLAAATEMGPLIHARRLAAVDELIRDAVAAGATLRTGGSRIGDIGHFYAPTVLTDVPETARIMTEEPFGPVAILQRYSDLDDACARANATDFGLAAYAFTHDTAKAAQIVRTVEAGIMSINQYGGASPDVPFGGVKNSGYGREGGAQSFDGYLVTKSVTQKTRRT